MPPIQPPFISSFFTNLFTKQRKKTVAYHQEFFLSWEDALWQLIRNHHLPKQALVLIPEFFCFDVVQNMRAHGLGCLTYQVDKYLQPDLADFQTKLKQHQPAIVIIFHAVGISNLLLQNTNWLKLLPKASLLIEDCVHRLVDPAHIKFLTKNHYIIDSLRKVAPIQGSRVFAGHHISTPTRIDNFVTLGYRSQVLLWWLLMQLALIWVT